MTVIGIDGYNQVLTGGVAKTLTFVISDCDHIPLVLIGDEDEDDTDGEEIL